MNDRLTCGHGVPMATLTGTICVACEWERQTARADAAERQVAELRAEVERLTAREAKLVEALQPFARIGEAWQATLQELLARHGAAIMGGNEEAYFHAARLLAEEHDHA